MIMYLPFVTVPPSQSRQPLIEAGSAWYHWSDDFTQLDRLHCGPYYNTNSFRDVSNGRAMPVIRYRPTDHSLPDHWRNICGVLGVAYDGKAKVLNEPERTGQDEIDPIRGKVLVAAIKQKLPKMTQVGPNVLAGEAGFKWFDEYLEEGGRLFNIIGFHLYPQSGMEPGEAVDEFRRIIKSHGYSKVIPEFWVTEMGVSYTLPDAGTIAKRWLRACIDNPFITAVFWYTAWKGSPRRLDMILPDLDGEPGVLSSTGKAWIETWYNK